MPNTKQSVSVTTDRILEEPCEATSLTHGFEAERRGRSLRLGNQLDILNQGVEVWNQWREDNPTIQPDLSQATLNGLDLSGYNLSGVQLWGAFLGQTKLIEANLSSVSGTNAAFTDADLSKASMSGSNFSRSNFSRANLYQVNLQYTYLFGTLLKQVNLNEANLNETNLSEADLSFASLVRATLVKALLTRVNLSYAWLTHADLRDANLNAAYLANANLQGAYLSHAYLTGVNFTDATLHEAHLDYANLKRAIFVGTDLTMANLSDSFIHGISSWDVQLEGAIQHNLIITSRNEPQVTVDNLEVAQFIYLLLNNKKIRDVIDTITSKIVLILGRFTPERKAVLDAIRDELRKQNYLPVLFDFEKPANRDLTETVSTLAHLARFIIVDLTDPSSAPHEVATIIPHCVEPVQPLLTLQPLIIDGKAVERHEYAMFQDLRRRHPWVLPTFRYQDTADLLGSLKEHIIDPAEQKAKELAQQ
jgi:uncharacterized protein YjbI with pentapeptide repeats